MSATNLFAKKQIKKIKIKLDIVGTYSAQTPVQGPFFSVSSVIEENQVIAYN